MEVVVYEVLNLTRWACALCHLDAFPSSSVPAGSAEPISIDIEPSAVYIPTGFDNNDVIQFHIEWEHLTQCVRTYNVHVETGEGAFSDKVFFSLNALEYPGCEEAKTPYRYSQTIDIGRISKPGSYELWQLVENDRPSKAGFKGHLRGRIDVAFANSDRPDEYNYARVDGAILYNSPSLLGSAHSAREGKLDRNPL